MYHWGPSVESGSCTHVRMWQTNRLNFLHHLYIESNKDCPQTKRHTNTQLGGGVYVPVFMSLHSWWHKSPVKLLQTHKPNLGHLYSSLCVCLSCHDFPSVCLYGWMLTSSSSNLCMHGEQTVICDILLWVEPRMTTDLYIGTLKRCPVAMAPRVAGCGKERMKASYGESSHFGRIWVGRVEFQLSDRFSGCCWKRQGSPSVIW